MNRNLIFSGLVCLMMPYTTMAQDKLYNDEFPLGDITLLDGPLKHARDLNVENLLKYDCDRMLAPYRKEAGLTPRKTNLPQLGRTRRTRRRTLSLGPRHQCRYW